MSRLTWDSAQDRKYELGVDRGVLYKKTTVGSGSSATTKWIGVPWNGLTAVTASPSGAEASDLWADNMKYATLRSAEQFGFTIEAYTYPDEFAACDGSATIDTSKAIKVNQQGREKFGFCYRTDKGNAEDSVIDPEKDYIIHVIWGATANPTERSYSTINDSPEAITFSWECSCDPQVIDTSEITDTTIKAMSFKPVYTMDIDASKLEASKLTALLNMLWGKDAGSSSSDPATDPELPTPGALINLLTKSE